MKAAARRKGSSGSEARARRERAAPIRLARRPDAERLGAATAFGLPLVAYLFTLAPSITWRNGGIDSGDVATGVATLGVIHPPGYALYVAAAHAFAWLVPALEPAAATNLFCAVLAATASAVVFAACRSFLSTGGSENGATDAGVSLAAALAVSLGTLWWQQANLATVHALNVLFAALLLFVALRILEGTLTTQDAGISAFVLGLATTHHLTLLVFPGALIAAFVLSSGRRAFSRPGTHGVIAAVVGFGLGLTPWLALPLLAAAGPAHIWNDPTTLAGWLDTVLARSYQDYLSYSTALGVFFRLALGIWTIAQELGPIGFLAALGGLAILWDERRRYALFVLAVVGMCLAFFARYAARDVESYLLPAAITAAPAAAFGLREVAREVGRRVPRIGSVGAAWISALASAVLALGLGWGTMDLSRDREAIDYARGALAEAPPNALVISETDPHTFSLWYARYGLGLRPDTAVIDRWLPRFAWYRKHLARLHPDLRIPSDGSLLGPLLAARMIADRPVVATSNDPNWGTPLERGRYVHRLIGS